MTPGRLRAVASSLEDAAARSDDAAGRLEALVVTDLGPAAWRSHRAVLVRGVLVLDAGSTSSLLRRAAVALTTRAARCRARAAELERIAAASQADTGVVHAPRPPTAPAPVPVPSVQ